MPGRARVGALLLAGLLAVAACGTDSSGPSVEASSTTAGAAVAPAPGEAPAAPGEAPPPAEPPAAAEEPPAVAPPAPAAPPPSSSSPAPPAPVPADPPTLVPAGPVGSYAVRYLRPSESQRVLVQVLAQEGAGPDPTVPERIRQVLSGLSGKPVSVATTVLSGGARSWTGDELRALADQQAPAQSHEQAVLTLLFLRGGFADSDRAVGVSVRGDVAAIFTERVDEAAGLLGNRAAVEDAVTMHEVGHLLGLVDLVLDTGRQDPDHPGHSPNRGSVMYYAVESTLLGRVLSGGPPRDFDQDDRDDLARIRNG